MWLLCAGTATSQSTVTNTQVQLGDVFSSQQLDVVTQDDTTAVTTATANSLSGTVENGDLDIQSQQTAGGQVSAATTVNVGSYAGSQLTATTASTGNTGDAGIDSGGTLSGHFTQTVTGPSIASDTQVNAEQAQADNAALASQAIGNSQGFGATDSTVTATVGQTNAAETTANGGAIIQYVPGDGTFSAAAVGNNVSSVGVGNSSQELGVTQSQTSDLVRGAQFTNMGTSQNTDTAATATANNISATNAGGSLTLTDSQSNDAYVRAQAVETSWEFGGATTSAYGVGNSTLAGNAGQSLVLDNTQVNGAGGVEAVASFTGDHGYDANVSATAMGNAVTGYACSQCQATMSVTNSQTNIGDVGSTSSLSLTGAGRSARGVATSVGNSATFYVTKPGN